MTCTPKENALITQLSMILARSVWLFVVTDLDKISIIEVMLVIPICSKITPKIDPHHTSPTELMVILVEVLNQRYDLPMEKPR